MTGSLEAIEDTIDELPDGEVFVDIVRSGIGPVTDGDIEYAATVGGESCSRTFNAFMHTTTGCLFSLLLPNYFKPASLGLAFHAPRRSRPRPNRRPCRFPITR